MNVGKAGNNDELCFIVVGSVRSSPKSECPTT